jgi:hypothetical protein
MHRFNGFAHLTWGRYGEHGQHQGSSITHYAGVHQYAKYNQYAKLVKIPNMYILVPFTLKKSRSCAISKVWEVSNNATQVQV